MQFYLLHFSNGCVILIIVNEREVMVMERHYYLEFEWLCEAVYYGEMSELEADEIAYEILMNI